MMKFCLLKNNGMVYNQLIAEDCRLGNITPIVTKYTIKTVTTNDAKFYFDDCLTAKRHIFSFCSLTQQVTPRG